MFGFNKERRLIEGPVEFTFDIQIDRPASEVFPLIDVADARFSHAQRGAQLRRVEGETGRYDMVLAEMEDAVFQFTVLERIEGVRHSLSAVMVPQLFALEKSIEEHVIEPLGETACRVTLKTSATFDAGLSDDEMASEIAVMSTAVARDLEKLKLLAEEGLEAVREAEQAEMEFDLGFDLGELDIDWDDIEPEQ